MRAAGRILLSIAIVLVSTPLWAHREPEVVPGEFLVKMKQSRTVSAMSKSKLSMMLDSRVKEVLPHNILLIQRAAVEQPAYALNLLRNNPDVELAEPNYIYRNTKIPNDPYWGLLWGMMNSGQEGLGHGTGVMGVDINATKAWDITTGTPDVVIASIDSGVDYMNPDLAGNMWQNEAEVRGQHGIDDDRNGYVDDIHGWNFVNNTADPRDDQDHGSHTSGTMAARGDDGVGVAGVAWKSRIMALKFLSADGAGSLDGALKAINYATIMGAKVMNNSWGGGGFSQLLFEAIQRANANNALFVAAAGNDGANNDQTPSYPSNYKLPNIISVAAVDNRAHLAEFSNFGRDTVHIAAPGVDILSTTPEGLQLMSGTSMATPHVSGIAALVWAHEPNLTAYQVKERILTTARPFSSLNGKLKYPAIANAYFAVANIIPPPNTDDPANWTQQRYTLSTPHPYPDKYAQSFTIKVAGAKRMAVYFSRFQLEPKFDKVEFFNGKGQKVGELSGSADDSYSPVVEGDTIILKMMSDETKSDYGFDISAVAIQ